MLVLRRIWSGHALGVRLAAYLIHNLYFTPEKAEPRIQRASRCCLGGKSGDVMWRPISLCVVLVVLAFQSSGASTESNIIVE